VSAGGWHTLKRADGRSFRNVGDCVVYDALSDHEISEWLLRELAKDSSSHEGVRFVREANALVPKASASHVLTENRNGLVVDSRLTQARGTAEREAALDMLAAQPGESRKTVGADKLYDTEDFIAQCRALNITPYVACNDKRRGGSQLDDRTTRHESYKVSQRLRKRIEETFGWGKAIGLIRQVKVRGIDKVNLVYQFTCMGWNLVRMRNLLAAGA